MQRSAAWGLTAALELTGGALRRFLPNPALSSPDGSVVPRIDEISRKNNTDPKRRCFGELPWAQRKEAPASVAEAESRCRQNTHSAAFKRLQLKSLGAQRRSPATILCPRMESGFPLIRIMRSRVLFKRVLFPFRRLASDLFKQTADPFTRLVISPESFCE